MANDNDVDWASIIGLGDPEDSLLELKFNKKSNNKPIDLEVKLDVAKEKEIYNMCPKCKIQAKISEGIICCYTCGYTNHVMNHISTSYSVSLDKDHNTAKNSFMSFKIVGKNSYGLQRSLLRTSSNYKAFSKNTNKKDLQNYVFQYEGKKIPKDATDLANELFSKIKDSGYIYRANGKKGVMGACLYFACVIKGITKTPKEITSVMKIRWDSFLIQPYLRN